VLVEKRERGRERERERWSEFGTQGDSLEYSRGYLSKEGGFSHRFPTAHLPPSLIFLLLHLEMLD